MVKFFIERPIFAWVLAIILMLAGGLAILKLPVAQYPTIAPPAIAISASYPGADAQTVQDTVTQVIEQNMNGLDSLMYMSSTSDSSGSVTVTLTFDSGTDPDIAQVQVQNKLQLAMPLLPQEVQQQGISVKKSSSSFLMVAGFISTDNSMSQDDIADYISSNIKDPISRTEGVGDTQLFGAQYSMRIWLDPNQLNKYQLTTLDVVNQLKIQNNQIAAGQLGGVPAIPNQQLNVSIIAQTRLKDPAEFSRIQLKVMPDGARVLLKDVARIELGGENYNIIARYNGKPAAGLGIKLATGANALDTAKAVQTEMEKLKPYFPKGLAIVYTYDTTPFIKISIQQVVQTLFEAIILVFMVMYLFLQNFRATLIPTIAVPVVLLGTFAVLSAFGYSINTLTMFGMVLAIGLLVDDAIVVVENVERVMSEEGLPPKEATKKSMEQIQSALVGITMVLSAVLVPMAFFSGSTGIIYRQFSITIVSAMALSVLMALIFTPALCATIIKHNDKEKSQKGFSGWFNRTFDKGTVRYTRSVATVISRRRLFMGLYLLMVIATGFMFTRVPTTFLPDEDQGVMMVQATLPANASAQRTQQVLDDVRNYLLTQEGSSVKSVFTANGFSFAGRGQNVGIAFVMLKDWSLRKDSNLKVQALAGRAMAHFGQLKDARVFAFVPPAVMELGNATGFDFFLQDTNGRGHEALMAARNQFLQLAAGDPRLTAVRPNGMEDEPEYQLSIDDERAQALGLSMDDINNTLSAAWGSAYVNQFMYNDRVKRVYIQGKAASRVTPEDLGQWYFRNSRSEER